MALVRLSDAVIYDVYMSYSTDNIPERTRFFESGAIVRNAMLDGFANDRGKMAHVPFWKDIDPTDEPNYSTDDPAVEAVPDKIGSGEFQTRKAFLNKFFSDADLVAELAGSNPMQHIRNRFGTYWTRQWQRRSIAALVGVAACNVANDGGDMVHDVSIADGNAAVAANLFSRQAFIDAVFTMGDHVDNIRAIAVHSVVYKTMVENDDITFTPDSTGSLTIPTYMGKAVLVDDGLSVVAGATSGFVYTSILYGSAALGYGEGTPSVPVEMDREMLQGNGGGVEIMGERKTWLIHPFGFNWTETTLTGGAATIRSPNLADLRLAANWTRVTARKNVPLAFLKTNG